MTYTSDYPIINVTADVMVFVDESVLLVRRARAPYRGRLAFPGGFVDAGERTRDAAVRELREETGLVASPDELQFVGVADQPRRDPRGPTVSMVFKLSWRSVEHDMSIVKPGSDAAGVVLVGFDALRQMRDQCAFDHWDVMFGEALMSK